MVTRVGILDYHNKISDNLYNLFECNSNCTVAFFTNNGKECLYFLEQTKYTIDVLLLDSNVYDKDWDKILQLIRRKYFHIKVLFLNSHSDYYNFYFAMNSGVSGYILQQNFISEIFYAIDIVKDGVIYIDHSLSENYKQYIEERKSDDIVITKREKQVLSCLASGMINKEIAIKLEISEDTVKSHLRRLYKKIKVNDRTQAALYAIKHNFIEEL